MRQDKIERKGGGAKQPQELGRAKRLNPLGLLQGFELLQPYISYRITSCFYMIHDFTFNYSKNIYVIKNHAKYVFHIIQTAYVLLFLALFNSSMFII